MWSVGRTLWQEHFFNGGTLRPQRPYGLTRTSTSTFTKLLSSAELWVQVLCCFTSTETTKTIRDVEPRTSTSTFKQLLSSLTALFYFFCNAALRPQRPHGLLGTSTRMSTSTLTQLLSSDDQRTRTGLFSSFFYNNAAAGHWSIGTSGSTMKGLCSSLANLDEKTLVFILRLHIRNFCCCCCCCCWWWWWCLVCSHLSCFVAVLFVCFDFQQPGGDFQHPPPPTHTHTKKNCLQTVSVIGRRSTVAGWTVRCEPGF